MNLKRNKKWLAVLSVAAVMIFCCCTPVFALTEQEVKEKIEEIGREAFTGQVFIWFLCAVGFLKVSQRIDSFLSALGINVGNTGGSMLAEAMIAVRAITSLRTGGHGTPRGGNAGSSSPGFLSGGLAGAVGRSVQRSAVRHATGAGRNGLGGKTYDSSVNRGGGFANRVIGTVATGSIPATGTISGAKASAALSSYLGYTALGEGAADIPSYSDVEIGGGRITATEISAEHPEGIAMGMYHTDQYLPPKGEYATVTAADGTSWYQQYAADAVERKPYQAPDGSVAYHEKIVKKLPDPPKRKDRV